MNVVHLTASPFFGGPERQMLGLAQTLSDEYRSIFLSYSERGLCRPFLEQLRHHGFEAVELRHNVPKLNQTVREVVHWLREFRGDVLCCHGYKPDVLGLVAARRVGVPVVSVSRGWTAATLKVRVYDWLDRISLHAMNAVVCVSEGQAAKVRRVGVPASQIRVIRNAIDIERFSERQAERRREVEQLLPRRPRLIVGAAGRLSPEKGFAVLIDAAELVARTNPEVGFVIFGDGPLRQNLEQQILQKRLEQNVVLPGFRSDLDRLLPCFDLVALPSFTEGLPNIVLEAFAARVPVVATAVGGTPEVVDEGESGYLVPAGDVAALASKIVAALSGEAIRQAMGMAGFARVRDEFSFGAQAQEYQKLFGQLWQIRKARQRIQRRKIKSQ